MSLPGLDYADSALGMLENLIGLLAPLKTAAVPNPRAAASELGVVCKKLLDANESVTRWINKFRDFDLSKPTAISDFAAIAGDYRALRTGSGYQSLKFDCHEIDVIYRQHLGGKLRSLFFGNRLIEAQAIFEQLSAADGSFVGYIHEVIFEYLNDICDSMESALDSGDLEAADKARLEFKVQTRTIYKKLEEIGVSLADLVLLFKKMALQ